MRKFTDEELSRILGEADAGHLAARGCRGVHFALGVDTPCCINQAAYLEPSCGDAVHLNGDAAVWFDLEYGERPVSDPVELLRGLERKRLA